MIDAIHIFTKGGLVLWSLELLPLDKDLVDSFVKNFLLEHRAAENKFSYKGFEFRWISVNRLSAFILVIYKGILESRYVDTMLSSLKSKLVQKIGIDEAPYPVDLSSEFMKILDKCDETLVTRGVSPQASSKSAPIVSTKSGSPVEKKSSNSEGKGKKGKESRAWGLSGKVSSNKKLMEELDFSKPVATDTLRAKNVYEESSESDFEASDCEIDERSGGLFGKLVSSVQNVTGNAQLTQRDLDPVLASLQEGLMSKNVARDVAAKIVEGVGQSLVGTRTQRFTSVASTVKEAITRSIEEILTPKKSIDVLKAALDAKTQGRVFSIAFLGVNGVGKSTNLAKVAYYLKNKGGMKILLAACDTFRAGAVEQLRVHANNLNVDIFERGYGKDSAEIAKQALTFAKQNGYDVCLIDTAGRMQDNEPLMRAIAKLVAVNSPDLVLFVGEALVGHDAVDQLTKFNRSLIDYSHDPKNPRTVDGIVLTKYDTVDDKVGAALSMVYVTGQPIVFVGTGQKYPHLRKLQVKEVVKAIVG
jgi:signal recognition particle receptor subunit alpha